MVVYTLMTAYILRTVWVDFYVSASKNVPSQSKNGLTWLNITFLWDYHPNIDENMCTEWLYAF